MSIDDVLRWLEAVGPDISQFALLAWVILRQQYMIEHCAKWDGDREPEQPEE